jgi:hypothetical protein
VRCLVVVVVFMASRDGLLQVFVIFARKFRIDWQQNLLAVEMIRI